MTSRDSWVAIQKTSISPKQLDLVLEMKFQFAGDAKDDMTEISSRRELSTNKEVHGMPDDDIVDWNHVRAAEDPTLLPGAIDEMMNAPTPEIAKKAYWCIEGNAFFQRELYQAAEPVTRLVVDRIRNGQWTRYGLGMGLDLLVEVAMGWPALSEQMHGDNALDQHCRPPHEDAGRRRGVRGRRERSRRRRFPSCSIVASRARGRPADPTAFRRAFRRGSTGAGVAAVRGPGCGLTGVVACG